MGVDIRSLPSTTPGLNFGVQLTKAKDLLLNNYEVFPKTGLSKGNEEKRTSVKITLHFLGPIRGYEDTVYLIELRFGDIKHRKCHFPEE